MMAAGGDCTSYEKLSSEFLMCPLCFEQFSTPKVLPCQHTFCLACLRNYVAARGFNHTIPCPLCKETVIIPSNDVSNFKNNFTIVSLLHFVEDSKKAQAKEKGEILSCASSNNTQEAATCGACSDPGTLASFCQLCSLWLCAVCTKAHGRLPTTSSHILLSNEEVARHCKAMVDIGMKSLTDLQHVNIERQDFLLAEKNQLPEKISLAKRKIQSSAEEAQNVIREKGNNLLDQVEHFQQDQQAELSQKLEVVAERRRELSRLLDLLETIKLSNDGLHSQNAIKMVDGFISRSSVTEFSCQTDSNLSLAFSVFNSNLTELKNLEMGHLRVVSGQKRNCQYLQDRPLQIHKVVSLMEPEYITALAINKFADKFIVANNESVFVFKPDSKVAKPFLSPLCERNVTKPWGIAYFEDDRRIFVTECGRHEGDGAVVAYSLDGTFHSVIASGLTLPRGIAIHKNFLFVCDQIDRCVYVFNVWGKIIRVLKKTPDGKYLFNGPMFISVGRNGTLAVSDSLISVKVFDKDCVLKFTYTSSLPECQFWDVHVMQNGTVLLCDWKQGLHKISPDFSANGLVTTETNMLREPSALAALENGNCIYVGTCGGEVYSVI